MKDNSVETLEPVDLSMFGNPSDSWTPQVIPSIIEETKRLEREKLTAQIIEERVRQLRESMEGFISDGSTQDMDKAKERVQEALKRLGLEITEIDSNPETCEITFTIKLT